MSLLHRTRPAHNVEPGPESGRPVPRTRTGAAWVSVCVAALIAVALIVFLVQNTRGVEISFLWMTTHTSLALALLIAAVGAVLLTLVLGTARITQLRRHARVRGATSAAYTTDIRQPPTANHIPEQHADPRS